MPNVNMNYSYSSGIAPTLAQAYIQKKALENVEPMLGYLDDADQIEQPKGESKHVRMWRYTELAAVEKPLEEGVTPDGQSLSETAFDVMTKPYGGWMAYTDEINLFHVDSKTDAMAERLSRQAALSIDTAGRNAICAGLNVMYPAGISARSSITSSNILTYAIIKKVVRNLKKAGAQPFPDGYFHAKISHDTYYDLTSDSHWIAVAQYQDDRRVKKNELGEVYRVKFFEVDNPMIFKNASYLYGTTAELAAASLSGAEFNRATRTMTISATMTDDVARELTGKLVYVQYTKSATACNTLRCIERISPSGTANKTQIVFRWVPASSVTDEWTYAQSLKIVPCGGGASNAEVHATIIYGQHAFGTIKLGGKGKPNIQIIVKPLGSSGTEDPLNQRGTVGWKVNHFACAVIQDDFIVRVEHGVSA